MTTTSTRTDQISSSPIQQPSLANLSAGETVEGLYRVAHVRRLETPSWNSTLITLRDANGSIDCLAEPSLPTDQNLAYRAIHVRFSVGDHPKHGRQGRLISLEVRDEVPEALVLDLLPRSHKLEPLVACLYAVLARLSPHLQSFALGVLGDDAVTRALCGKPASATFHHIEHGGLLRHAVEMAEQIGGYDDIAGDLRELAQVAALFHDVGKTRTLNWRGRRTDSGQLIPHEALILPICEGALRELRRKAPKVADVLCHLWTAAYPGQYGIPPQTPLVKVLRDADRNSVMHDKWLRKCAAAAKVSTSAAVYA